MSEHSNESVSHTGASRRKLLKTAATGMTGGLVALAGCSGGSGGAGTTASGGEFADKITFMGWGGNFGDIVNQTLVEPFREEHDITVEFVPLPSPAEMLSKLQAGSLGVDVVSHWNYTLYQGVQQDLFQPIRTENVPNLDKVIDGYQPSNVDYNPGDTPYHVPNTIGGNGIAYNEEEMDEPTTWEDIFSEEFSGQVSIPSWTATSVGIIAKAAGLNLDDSLPDNIDKVWEKAQTWDEYMYDWWSSGQDMQNYLSNDSVYAGMLWYARVYGLVNNQDEPLAYTIPEDGTSTWVETYSVPKGVSGKKRKTAEYFINWVYSEDALENLVNEMPYSIPYDWSETPDVYDDHPEQQYLGTDRIEPWSSSVLEEHRQEWSTKFRQITSG